MLKVKWGSDSNVAVVSSNEVAETEFAHVLKDTHMHTHTSTHTYTRVRAFASTLSHRSRSREGIVLVFIAFCIFIVSIHEKDS